MLCELLLALTRQDGAPSFRAPDAAEIAAAPTFAADERIVATHYFYWYRWPDSHLDQLSLHFPAEREVSFESAAWHRGEIEDALAAGIDVLLPVYWGALDHYDKPDVAFSVRGLPPLVEALDAVAATGRRPPRIGMFYDTSTLLNAVRGAEPREGRADLRTAEGRDVFERTIGDFFRQVPPRHWAQLDGRPLVVLYGAGFAAGWDQRTFDELAERFARDFAGRRPFVVRDASWTGVHTEASCAWGAALDGPHLGEGTVQIGPGYDDSPVRGRQTPIREREGGRFYEKSWRAALRSDARLALLETWNENHEGTAIAETVEHGRAYIELTARYAALFRQRATLPDDIALEWPAPRPRPDLSWGAAARGRESVDWRAPDGGLGLRPIAWVDGPYALGTSPEGDACLRAEPSARTSYVYFQVSDAFAFDVTADYELELALRAERDGALEVQYDGHDDAAPFQGAYTRAAALARSPGKGWSVARFLLGGARLANRQNGGADLRLCLAEGLSLRSATLRARR